MADFTEHLVLRVHPCCWILDILLFTSYLTELLAFQLCFKSELSRSLLKILINFVSFTDLTAALFFCSNFPLYRKELLKLMKKNRHLLNVDEYLFRSWFSLLPLSNLASYMEDLIDYLSQSPPRVLDCLLGTWYQLEGLKEISNRNLQVCCLELVLESLLNKSRSKTNLSEFVILLFWKPDLVKHLDLRELGRVNIS